MTETIYVVDDESMNLELISLTLKSAGYEVFTAQNGADTLKNIGAANPNLAILDVMMPDMDGYELCQRLRARADTANIPIIILTALTSPADRLKAFDARADDFISKPVHPKELLTRVSALLRRFAPQGAPVTNLHAETTAIFSLRGGAGVSTVATNLAVGFAQIWNLPAALVDLALVNGQSALMLDVPVRNSWRDVANINPDEIDADILQKILVNHESGLRVLACPKNAEDAELLTVEHVRRVLALLQRQFEYLVLDLPHDFSPLTLAALDMADQIVLLSAPELASIRCLSAALDVFDKLDYPADKIKLLLNWTFYGKGLGRADIERVIKRKIDIVLPNAGDTLANAITIGKPPAFKDPAEGFGALFEDLAYQLSAAPHKDSPPQNTKDGYKRVLDRARARQK